MLLLKRASKSRPGGPWPDDDYDVFDGDLILPQIARESYRENQIQRCVFTHAGPEADIELVRHIRYKGLSLGGTSPKFAPLRHLGRLPNIDNQGIPAHTSISLMMLWRLTCLPS